MSEARRAAMDVVKTMAQSQFAKRTPSEETLRATIQALAILESLGDDEVEQIFNEVCEVMNVHMEMGIAIEADQHQPWLADRAPEWNLWSAYHDILAREGRGPHVLGILDQTLNRILDHLGDPLDESHWKRRSLVIGEVQSGKTSTYIGLIDKAIDVGYRVIVLLGGHTELLRRQTQERIDFGVIGRNSSRIRAQSPQVNGIGVGETCNTAFIDSLTTQVSDFRKSSLEAHNIVPGPDKVVVFVTKKNVTVLSQIAKWFDNAPHGTANLPMLLIDDESDYASINVNSSDKDPTAINKAIRALLGKFTRNSYVAFTATPFANIFIDDEIEDDLFPKDLIYALDSPSNYVGCASYFGDNQEIDPVRRIDDADAHFPLGHKKCLSPDGLPDSLLEAIRTYLLTNAIRDLRGQHGAPTSMLINVSRFVDVQQIVFDHVRGAVSGYRNAIELHSGTYSNGVPNRHMDELRTTFERQFPSCGSSWMEVLSELRRANFEVETLVTNANSAKRDDVPKRHVSVGGDLLSRGLTLEGLSTSYFYRRTQAADTLMQMARWFGYRPGYSDLCRLWITDDMCSAYQHSLATLDDLRIDLKEMERQRLTPRQFGISVKLHPEALAITARNKMRAGALHDGAKSISLRGIVREATRLPSNDDALRSNIGKFRGLLNAAVDSVDVEVVGGSKRVWRGLNKALIAEFLDGFEVHPNWSQRLFMGSALPDFVRQARADDLQSWDLVVFGGRGEPNPEFAFDQLPDWKPPVRSFGGSSDEGWTVSGKRMRILGPADVATTLDPSVVNEVKSEFNSDPENAGKKSVPDRLFTRRLQRPVLFVFPIQAAIQESNSPHFAPVPPSIPLIAIAIAVPGERTEKDGDNFQYLFNVPAQRLFEQSFEDLEYSDEDSDDDE